MSDPVMQSISKEMLETAAQTNERLRAEIERLRAEVKGHLKAWDIQRADVERLKAALQTMKAERDIYEHKWRTNAWD